MNLKIFTVILLAGLFLFNTIGYHLLFAFLILHEEEKMYSILTESSNESLEVIVIDSSDHPEFLKVSEKEFFYKGSLYDVKYKEVKNGKAVFHCKKDEKELNLLNHFSRMNDENKSNSSKNPLNRFLQKSAQNLFFTSLQFMDSLFPRNKFFIAVVSLFYEQPDSFRLTPPPQICFS